MELVIWIDAICINQQDEDERSWQVQQMSDAHQVVIWLGLGDEESRIALQGVDLLAPRFPVLTSKLARPKKVQTLGLLLHTKLSKTYSVRLHPSFDLQASLV